MGVDPISPVAPARVRVLLLPVGRIRRARFIGFLERLRPENIVRLGDVSPDGRPHRNMFSPLAAPSGMIIYDLTTALPPPSHLALSPFELFREPLAVVGIADGAELGHISFKSGPQVNGDDSAATRERDLRNLDQDLEIIRDQYSNALAHQVLVFDYVHPKDAARLPEGVVAVPPPEQSRTTTMKTVMCDLSSLLLAEMTTMAKSIQALPTIESPGHGLDGASYNGNSDMHARRGSQRSLSGLRSRSRSPEKKNMARMSMPVVLEGESSWSSYGRPGAPKSNGDGLPISPTRDASSPDRGSTKSPTKSPPSSLVSRQMGAIGREHSRDSSRDRVSLTGFGSGGVSERSRNMGKGRVGVVIGSLYLHAGRCSDAMRELVAAATILKTANDHLWHAKALENILVCMLMFGWTGLDFQIPMICYSSADKAAHHTPLATTPEARVPASNRLAALQNLSTLLPELLDRILNLYNRAANFTGESLPQLPFSETVIRFSKLLMAVHLSGGKINDDVLQTVVLGVPLPKGPNLSIPRIGVTPSRTDVVTMLHRAYPSSLSTAYMSVTDRAIILGGMATVLGSVGYHRKKAIVMRELIAVLIPGLVQARKVGAAEIGVHPAAGLAALGSINGSSSGVSALDLGEGDIEAGMDTFLGLLARTYGVVGFEPWSPSMPKSEYEHTDDSDEAVIARILRDSSLRMFGSVNLKLDVLRACINLSEALPDFHGVLKFTTDLLRTAGSGVAPGPRSDDASPCIPRDEQVRLSMNISRTVSAANRLGIQGLETEYWDEFLVRGVEVDNVLTSRTPIPHKKTELEGVASSSETKDKKNPFIYNPFLKKAAAAAAGNTNHLVAGEPTSFKVTLQNPYDFDVEIESIALQSEGIEFESSTQSTVIGPYRTQILSVSGVPKEAGQLTIRGCIVKTRGCRSRRFPIFKEPWSPFHDTKIKASGLAAISKARDNARPVSLESTKLNSSKTKPKRPVVPQPKVASVTLGVIDKQPAVVIKSSSLSQSALMVLEGERKVFTITLTNLSTTTPADLLLFSFQDSTQAPLQTALSNRDAPPAELYEYEVILSRRQAVRRREEDGQKPYLAPGETKAFEFEVLGKPGLTNAVVCVDYTCLGKEVGELGEEFWTRQASLPLTVTVNASVEVVRMDVLPLARRVPRTLWGEVGGDGEDEVDEEWKGVVEKGTGETEQYSGDTHCLLTLDIRNIWPGPLTLDLTYTPPTVSPLSSDPPNLSKSLFASAPPSHPSNKAIRISETVQPATTARLTFPIARTYLPNPHAPIPTLDASHTRQFVVSRGKVNLDAERQAREVFWQREKLLSCLEGRWRTVVDGGHAEDRAGELVEREREAQIHRERRGSIDLRALRLSPRMVEVLAVEDVGIEIDVEGGGALTKEESLSGSEEVVKVETDAFLQLVMHVTNRSPKPVYPFLRIQPSLNQRGGNSVALDLSKKFAWDGVLQRAMEVLQSGETGVVRLGCVALCRGIFEVGVSVEEARIWDEEKRREEGEMVKAQQGDEHLVDVLARRGERERRIWYARRPLRLCVGDGEDDE